MTPQTIPGWILFVMMCISGPIAGYAASSLIGGVWDGKPARRRDVLTAGIAATVLLISLSILTFVDGL